MATKIRIDSIWLKQVERFNIEQKAQAMDALLAIFKGDDNFEPKSDRVGDWLFSIRDALIEDRNNYEAVCAKNRNNALGKRTKATANESLLQEDTHIETNKEISFVLKGEEGESPKPIKDNFEWVQKLYNEICVDCVKCQAFNDSRKRSVRARISDFKQSDDTKVAFIENFLKKVHSSDFLCGRLERSDFKASFDWIFNKSNFTKIIEGNYDNKPTKGGFQSSQKEPQGWKEIFKMLYPQEICPFEWTKLEPNEQAQVISTMKKRGMKI